MANQAAHRRDSRPPPIPRWHRGADPDAATLRRLYVDDGRTEREIAVILGISRIRVAEAMERSGIQRRSTRKPCPVTAATLKKLFSAPEATTASIACHFGVADATAARWLAVAGIPARSNRSRRPRGNRSKVTDTRLVDLYVRRKHIVVDTAAILGVSTEYLRKRLHEAGLRKRLGSFTPRAPWEPAELRERAVDLYEEGMSMKSVGEELEVSVGTVRVALHQAGVPVRRGGFNSHMDAGRTLLDDLYADPSIRKVLARYRVVIPETWTSRGCSSRWRRCRAPRADLPRAGHCPLF